MFWRCWQNPCHFCYICYIYSLLRAFLPLCYKARWPCWAPSFLFVTKLAGNSHLTNETGTMHDIIAKRLNLINGQIDSSTGKIKENWKFKKLAVRLRLVCGWFANNFLKNSWQNIKNAEVYTKEIMQHCLRHQSVKKSFREITSQLYFLFFREKKKNFVDPYMLPWFQNKNRLLAAPNSCIKDLIGTWNLFTLSRRIWLA